MVKCKHGDVMLGACVYISPMQIREVLENYLDDDQDMRDMNLTAKEQHALQVAEAQVRGNGKEVG